MGTDLRVGVELGSDSGGVGLARNGMALVPFSHASPFHNPKALRERLFVFDGLDAVTVRQEWVADGHGGTAIGFGAAVYEASFVLADFLVHRTALALGGKTVLELGSGVGLVSVIAARLGALRVLATDGDPKSVSLTRENLLRNGIDARATAAQLLWGHASNNVHGSFDVVLAADVVALPYKDDFEDLVKSLVLHTHAGSVLLLAHKPRGAVEELFFDLMQPHFRKEPTIGPEDLHPDFIGEDISVHAFVRVTADK